MDPEVKSATRVLRILELFEDWQREAGVMEIARALAIPQSSTSVLLRNLVDMGYLQLDAARRTFAPTSRLTRLGAWIEPMQPPDAALVAAMEEIGRATGATVILGTQAGDQVRYVHIVPATTPLRLHLRVGITRPLALSGMGRLFMAQMERAAVREIVSRHNAGAGPGEIRLRLAAVLRDLAAIRSQQFSVSLARVTQGAGVVAVSVPRATGTPKALGIGAPVQVVREQQANWVALMRNVMARHLRGPLPTDQATVKAGSPRRGHRKPHSAPGPAP